MWETRITAEYGLKVPLIGMGALAVASPTFVAAVCEAGGMGMLAASCLSPKELRARIEETRRKTRQPFGVHFGSALKECAHIEICLQERVAVVSFEGDNPPEAYIARLRCGGIHVWMEVNSRTAARSASEARADAVILQCENRLSQVVAVVDAVSPVPVIVGDMGEGRYVAAALALGADAVCVEAALKESREAWEAWYSLKTSSPHVPEEPFWAGQAPRPCRTVAEIITGIMQQTAETIRDRLARMT